MPSGTLNGVLRRLRSLVGGPPVDELADDQLLGRFVARRDPVAFAALVERFGPLVLGVCRRTLGDPHDAEDAFQATFLVFSRRAGSIRNQGLVGSWLCSTAYRISLKAKVTAARRRAQELQAGQMPKHDSKLDTAWQELRPILDEELNHLPEKYRAPLVLCYLEGKTNEVAAKELGWPAGSISYRLTKGRELLKQRLLKRGITVTTALLGPALAAYATSAVPVALAEPTIKAGLLFSAGQTVAHVLSTSAVALAESVLHTIHLVKMLLVGLGVLSVVVVAGTSLYLINGRGPERPVALSDIVTPLDGEPRVRVQFSDAQRIGITLTQLHDPRNPAARKRLTRDADGKSNNTRYRIDGLEYLFGSPAVENRWLLRQAPIPQRPPDRAWQSVVDHGPSKVRIAQQVEIVAGEQTQLYDTVLIRYQIENRDSRAHVVGLRALVDTLIGINDGVPFLIPPGQRDSAYLLDTMAEFGRDRVPAFIRAIESDDLSDPTATVAEMGLRLKGVEPIDRLVICRWPDSPDARWGGSDRPGDWQYEAINANPQNLDSCVVLYWAERPMQPGEKRELAFTYGLGRISSGQSKPREQVRLLIAGSWQVGRTFTATAYFKGIAPGQTARIDLPNGLELAEGQTREQVVPTPSRQGYAQVSWKVKATQTGEHEIGLFVAGWHTVRETVHIRERSLFD